MLRALYGGKHDGNTGEDGNTQVFTWYSPVTAVGATSITLARTFPFQINTAWKPTVTQAQPTVREFGIENMTLEMAKVPYPGHFMERGYNGIYVGREHPDRAPLPARSARVHAGATVGWALAHWRECARLAAAPRGHQ